MKTRPTLPADSHEPVSNRDRLKRYEWLASVARKSKGRSDADALDFAAAAAVRDLDLDIRDQEAQLGELDAYTVEYLTGLRDPRAWGPDAFLGFDPRIARTRRLFPIYVGRGRLVLLVGKRGSGKGQLVRAIADELGKRPHTVAMGAIPEPLAPSELFGHDKGAFTGADKKRLGLFRAATKEAAAKEGDTAIIYLDDVSECPRHVQAMLLTVLEDGDLRPVGSDKTVSIGRGAERKFILFSSSQPERLGKLRKDLFDRLRAQEAWLPPLRERGMDILLLADAFAERLRERFGAGPKTLSRAARLALLRYDWPGNVRQLRNVIDRAAVLCQEDDTIDAQAMAEVLREEDRSAEAYAKSRGGGEDPRSRTGEFPTLAEVKKRHVREAVRRSDGNVSKAAKLLGVPRSTLQSYLAKLRQDDGD